MAAQPSNAVVPSLVDAEWLARPATRAVFGALRANGHAARAVGGAVRNALLCLPVSDVDIATPATPEEVIAAARAAGLEAVPTGIAHGTVTVLAGRVPHEVTTLRRDVEAHGRHATVAFTDDWEADARRRDFTINALYCGADGEVFDPLGGYADLLQRRVRFIGDARERIREDFLRILRFFRFMAQYGDADAPDPEGLGAVRAEKAGLKQLSGERIRAELLRLLTAPGAVPALRLMRDAGIIAPLIGVDGNVETVARLAAIERHLSRPPDPVLRLAALSAGTQENLRERLKLSGVEADGLAAALRCAPALAPRRGELAAKEYIYRNGAAAFTGAALIDWARSNADVDDPARAERARLAERWSAPKLPVRGADVIALGVPAGPGVGRVMEAFETWWIAADFPTEPQRIAAQLTELARGEL
jgi:poly(A) polymerase